MIQKAYSVVLAVGLVILLGRAPAQAISLDFVPSSQGVVVGNPVSVDLVISGLGDMTVPSLSTFDLDVLFDSTLLTLDTTDADGDGVIDSVVFDPSGQLDLFGLGGNAVSAGLTGPGILNLFESSLDSSTDLDTLQVDSFTLATITFGTFTTGTSSLDIMVNALGDATPLPDGPLPLTADVRPGSITVRPETTVIPEPSTIVLLSIGFVGLFACSCYRRKRTRTIS